MATAVETSSQPTTPRPPANLAFASLVGAAYVVAAVVLVFYALPRLWAEYVSPSLGGNSFLDGGLLYSTKALAVVGLWWFGQKLAGEHPPKGVRGGISLMIAAAITIFFLTRAVGFWVEGYGIDKILTGGVGIGLVFLAGRFFLSDRGERWMVGLEEQGWMHTHRYKPALGQKVRRLTILGFLLIGGTGVYSLWSQGIIPRNWVLTLPLELPPVTVIPDARYVVPILLMGLTLWIAYRVVNMPAFAEFLIATEAEMNKVSWTSRKRLAQDTVVVLITTLLMTMFLLFVDLFWGWLLSRETVGVLPSRSATKERQAAEKPVDW
jgi:preprotein translocase SecE subunit